MSQLLWVAAELAGGWMGAAPCEDLDEQIEMHLKYPRNKSEGTLEQTLLAYCYLNKEMLQFQSHLTAWLARCVLALLG